MGEKAYCLRYVMQALSIHYVGRGIRRHGEPHMKVQVFKKIVEKSIRNNVSLNGRNGPKKLKELFPIGLVVESRSRMGK